MARDFREQYRLTVIILSSLYYQPEDKFQPRDTKDVLERGKKFASRLQEVFAQQFAAAVRVRTTFARHSSAHVAHAADLVFQTRQQWNDAQEVFTQFAEDMEDWVAQEWEIQEMVLREDIDVRVRVPSHAHHRAAQVLTPQSGPTPPPPLPPPPPPVTEQDIAAKVEGQQKRLNRMLWTTGFVALVFGILAASAWWNYFFVREELQLMREHLEGMEARADTPQSPPQNAQPPVVNCSPTQTCRPILRNN